MLTCKASVVGVRAPSWNVTAQTRAVFMLFDVTQQSVVVGQRLKRGVDVRVCVCLCVTQSSRYFQWRTVRCLSSVTQERCVRCVRRTSLTRSTCTRLYTSAITTVRLCLCPTQRIDHRELEFYDFFHFQNLTNFTTFFRLKNFAKNSLLVLFLTLSFTVNFL